MLSRSVWLAVGLLAAVPAASPARAEDKKDVKKEDKKEAKVELPKAVSDALKAKFPKAEVKKVSKEKEDGKVVYDIEFVQGAQKFEADIFEDGTIHNWEKEVAAKDLPEAVRKAVDAKYPKAELKTVMEVTEVKNGKDVLEGYEIELVSADKKEVEVMVAPDGKILEDSSDEKKEEKKDKK